MSDPAKKRTVLLYSGGVDSETTRRLYEPDVCLYIDIGSAYSDVELYRIRRTHGAPGKDPDWLEILQLHDLGKFELPNAIVPARNVLFAILASNYGNRILLAPTAGDRPRDKDYVFSHLVSALLSYVWAPDWWTEGHDNVRLELPVKNLSKAELIARWAEWEVEEGTTYDDALAALYRETFSCYTPRRMRACGTCKACWRKWVGFRVAGLDVRPGPGVIDELLSYVPEIRAGTYGRRQESKDILTALELEGALG